MYAATPHACIVTGCGRVVVIVNNCWHVGHNHCACIDAECNDCVQHPIGDQQRATDSFCFVHLPVCLSVHVPVCMRLILFQMA